MLDQFDLKGKRVLISGATSGIGEGISRSFINCGAHVWGLGRNLSKIERLSEELGERFTGIQIDLSNLETIEELLQNQNITSIDGFVHCAGIIYRRPIKLITVETFTNLMNVNVLSGALIAKSLYKHKRFNQGASLVYMSSVASTYSAIGNTMYMTSKGAVNSMVRGLALEMAKHKLRVNSIEPGLIKTQLTEGISEVELESVLPNYPLGRFGEITDVINLAHFLISDASNWITGQSIRIDGGLTLK